MRRSFVMQGAAVAVWLGIGSAVFAQAPAVPAPPAGAAGIVGLVQMAAAAAKACKAKLCSCPLGQLITNAGKPLNTAMGGLLCPPCCPPVKEDDLKKPSVLPAGACAKIMKEELEMPERRKAIRCLSHADCHWWPEAEAALITGLRTDPNECVRLEAAIALANGCCCTRKTLAALTIVVTGSKKDGNPSENSERVKAMSLTALQHCLATYVEEVEPKPPELPKKPAPPPAPAPPAAAPPAAADLGFEMPNLAYYDNLDRTPQGQIASDARRVLQTALAVASPTREASATTPAGTVVTARGPSSNSTSHSLLDLWESAQKVPGPRKSVMEPPASAHASAAKLLPARLPIGPATPVETTTVQLDFRE